ncbi:MAG: AarF/ABC1/UbiB kinase family protein [Puniceicoccaceae bacterium]|nr:MAG: AarF/ABC1/UbiB kinase family protein [Puniceicoccaceae bacterium]
MMGPFDLVTHLVRAKEIVAVLVSNGFDDLLQRINLPSALTNLLGQGDRERKSIWERIRIVAEELGPTFIKFGQLLSMRPDILPAPLILELRKLQDRVNPQEFAEYKAILEAQIGCPLEEVFSAFNEKPVACASLAQVYFARLKATGEEVAVKIQRPRMEKVIEADFDIMGWMARQVHENVEELKPYDLPSILEEVRRGVERELDFRHEARSSLFFNLQNPNPEEIFAPRIIEEWSGEQVLVMERVRGRRLSDFEPGSPTARKLALVGARSLFHQILLNGFFHADPHDGNLLVTDEGRLCLLDWGLTGQLSREMRYALVDLFTAFLQGDAERVVQIGQSLSRSGIRVDRRQMEREVLMGLREYFNPGTGEGEVGRALLRLLFIFGQNGIDLARDYSLMAKAVLSVEEAGNRLDPRFDLKKAFKPALKRLHGERYHPKEFYRRCLLTLRGAFDVFQKIPGELHRIFQRLEDDNLTVNLQHKGLAGLEDSINAASNKITLGVILGSLLIGSSLIITTGIRPYLFGYPALGIIGYLLAAILGIWVTIDILRRGKRH